MQLTVVLCNDSNCSWPNQTAPLSSLVCSQDCAGYFLFDLKWGLCFMSTPTLTARRCISVTKLPFLCFSTISVFSAAWHFLCAIRTDVQARHSFYITCTYNLWHAMTLVAMNQHLHDKRKIAIYVPSVISHLLLKIWGLQEGKLCRLK